MLNKLRSLPVLAAAVIGLVIVTGALAATFISDNDDSSESSPPESAAIANTPTQPPAPTATVGAAQTGELPDDVWTQLQNLPQQLQDDLLARLEAGSIGVTTVETVIEEYENRNQSVRVGTVIEATESILQLEVYSTGERAEVIINDETVIRRGRDDITPSELDADELVMVISMDDGETAFAITAFGVGAP